MKSEDNCFLRKSCDKPRQCVEKQRHYSADKGPYSQRYGFPSGHVRLWELDRKKGRAPKNWCINLWCWKRLLKVPWTARRSNQSILKEISPEYSLEELMLKLKLQYFGHLMWTSDSLEKSILLGQKEKRASEDEMAGWYHQWNGQEIGQTLGDFEGQGGWHAAVHGVGKSWTWLSDLKNSNKYLI